MRFSKICLLSASLILSCLFTSQVFADYATSEGLGNPNLVLEDETTRLSLFNFGNPAGLAFMPQQNRLDLALQAGRLVDLEEYTTNEGDALTATYSSTDTVVSGYTNTTNGRNYSVTTTETKTYLYYPNAAPDGTTLTPHTVFSWKRSLASASLAASGGNLYQGVRLSPTDHLTLQLIPLADWQTTFSSDIDQSPIAWQTGGWLRGAYQLLPSVALGAGILGTQSKLSQSGLDSVATQTQAEFGVAFRTQELFDDTDVMDLGIILQGGQGHTTTDTTIDYTQENQPLKAAFNGVYSYKSVMDVGLNVDYLYEDTLRTWDNQTLLDTAQRTLDYELQFRVRLPMIREDDLRFGVSFNNQAVGHPYPNGTLQTLDTETGALNPIIRTASSGISIGAALVPIEGSIVSLQYNIGSSLSRQDGYDEYLSDSGYTNFSLGAQYQIIKGLYLRASYVDQRVVYESDPYRNLTTTTTVKRIYDDNDDDDSNNETEIESVSQSTSYQSTGLRSESIYTQTGNFGISVEDGPWKVSLNVKYGLTTYSPSGWNIDGIPVDIDTVNKDKEEELSGLLSLSWMF